MEGLAAVLIVVTLALEIASLASPWVMFLGAELGLFDLNNNWLQVCRPNGDCTTYKTSIIVVQAAAVIACFCFAAAPIFVFYAMKSSEQGTAGWLRTTGIVFLGWLASLVAAAHFTAKTSDMETLSGVGLQWAAWACSCVCLCLTIMAHKSASGSESPSGAQEDDDTTYTVGENAEQDNSVQKV